MEQAWEMQWSEKVIAFVRFASQHTKSEKEELQFTDKRNAIWNIFLTSNFQN
jgi:hypothetical protein